MLQFVVGRSGAGKTAFLKQKLCALVTEKQADKLLFLVPEQLSFETEKDMLSRLGAKECRKVEVLSFTRLADFVYRQTGGLAGQTIDDGSRHIVMSLAIEQAQDRLELYQKQVGKPELIPLMLNALKELKTCAVTTQRLREAAAGFVNSTLRQKVMETALIADIYDAILEGSYIDPLDDLTRLYHTLSAHTLFEGYTVVVDGFSGFTAQEQKILEALIRQASLCMVSICGDAAEFASDGNLFFTTRRTKRRLKELAQKNGVPVLQDIRLDKPLRFSVPAISCLEERFERPASLPCAEAPEGVAVYFADDIYDECDFVARTIRSLTIEQGYTYKEIAVICRDINSYRGILDATLEKYGIAYFMDIPQEVSAKPLMLFALSAFACIHTAFSTDNLFRFIKTGLAGISVEEAATLENYAFVWNITGKKWLSSFTANPRGYSDAFTQEDRLELAALEDLREKVTAPLLLFQQRVRGAGGAEISKAVYMLLQDFDVPNTLKEIVQRFKEQGDLPAAQEQQRLWDLFMDALDHMALLLKDRPISTRRYSELLQLVVNSADLSFIPNSLDEVTVGTADRIRLHAPKAVFVIGAIENEFPRMPVAGGIFTDQERKALLAVQLPLYDSIEQLAAQEKFLSYSAISAPSEKLYVSYYRQNLQGESKTPSSIVREILRVFPSVAPQSMCDVYWTELLWAPQPAFERCAQHSCTDQNAQALLDAFFAGQKEFSEKRLALARFTQKHPPQISDARLAHRLFAKNGMKLSASQVERYYLCPFAYFCRYGLNTKERKSAQIDAAEYGSLVHFLMESVLKSHSVQALCSMQEEQLHLLLEENLQRYLERHFGGAQDKSKRYLAMLARMGEGAFQLIRHILQELSQSAFMPVGFEMFIGEGSELPPYTLTLGDHEKILVQGFIDRIDVMRAEGKTYIRVVDYKTGSKKFVLSDVLFGLNLQMLIYLSAITKNAGEKYGLRPVPAGVLYMPAAAAVGNAEKDDTAQDIEEKQAKNYRMNGLILDNIHVIQGMEKQGKGVYIPVTLKEEKTKKENKTHAHVLKIDKGKEYTVSEAQMHALFTKIDALVLQMAQQLFNGYIAPVPAKGSYDACKWCPYAAACGYKEGMPCRDITQDKNPSDLCAAEEKAGE